jgi:manganese/zinc/iron transport system permease protein
MKLDLLDPLFRGPFFGLTLLSILLTLLGTMAFFTRKSLIAEVIAHSSFPGALLGLVGSVLFFHEENIVFVSLGALIFSLLGAFCVTAFKKRVTTDSSMTVVLSGFFGFGVVVASYIQQTMPKYYRLASGYLFGQVSTMTDQHIYVYGCILGFVLGFLIFYFHRIKLSLFDPEQSTLMGSSKLEFFLNFLMTLAIILGIRGIGVVLVSSFFVAPALIGKKFANTFSKVLLFSSLFSVFIAFCSFYFFSKWPLGPTVVIVLSLFALVFLPKLKSGSYDRA